MGEGKASPKLWATVGITVAIIGCIGTILAATIGMLPDILIPTSPANSQIEYVGRVLSQDTNAPIHDAKVILDFQGAPPVVYTDSEGVYRFTINVESDKISGRVGVEADNYEKYDRNITLYTDLATIEDIRLVPLVPTFTPSPTSTSTPTPKSIQSTSTPTPMPPTFTPTAEPQTNENHMKSIGEGYSLNGVLLTLKEYKIGSSDIDLIFVVKNESNRSMTIRYQNSYFQLYDDTGRKYERNASCEYDTKQKQFTPGETETLSASTNGVAPCQFGSIGDFKGVISENAQYLVVKVSQFMDLQDMQWRIDLTPLVSSEQSPSPGEILALGEGFSAHGLILILTECEIGSSDIDLEFVVKNDSSGQMLVRYQNIYFELYDDLGNQYQRNASCLQDIKQKQFTPNETETLSASTNGVAPCQFGSIGDFKGVISENTQYLVVKVSQFMDLQDMQWRIDL